MSELDQQHAANESALLAKLGSENMDVERLQLVGNTAHANRARDRRQGCLRPGKISRTCCISRS
eukprot:2041577-Prorocentrum_lima.AAC.1